MARVKILLDKGETIDEAQESLIKAFQSHAAGEAHREDFQDPAARDVFNFMINKHNEMWQEILDEIAIELDKEV